MYILLFIFSFLKNKVYNYVDWFIKENSLEKEETFEYKINSLNDLFAKSISWEPIFSYSNKKNNVSFEKENNIFTVKIKNFNVYSFLSFIFRFVLLASSFVFLLYFDWFKIIYGKPLNDDMTLFMYVFVITSTIFFFISWLYNIFLFIKSSYKITFEDYNENISIKSLISKKSLYFEDVYCLQIINKIVHINRKRNMFYIWYETNLIKKDWKRINLFNHWNLDEIKKQTNIIWKIINKPVWDIV